MRQITQCFNATLASIYQEVTELNRLTALVQAYLGKDEASGAVPCDVSRFSKGTLVLAVKDAVWAAKLRYELPSLRDHLRRAGGLHQLTSIRIHLSPSTHAPVQKKKNLHTPHLSEQTKHMISDSAKHCQNAPLKAALERLSAHHASTKSPSG